MNLRGFAIAAVILTGCMSTEHLIDAYTDIEECESEASTATGLYKAGISQGRTWLDIKNQCLRLRQIGRAKR